MLEPDRVEEFRHSSRYLTTSIPYVNAPPHVGFAMELIQADCLARHYRREGYTVRFQSGSDENSLSRMFAQRKLWAFPLLRWSGEMQSYFMN